ncbi:hypothetical protein [Permianibacter aggregans]|uniref:Lipocalin-like protein n=1 Tax=Permianibacter aggregans TaxID=1510150 RepID=A0A4R6USF4_9GAMM|nr:hypothetical protein [Permianibacter aggregans]QGX40002.1 hypothetical protein E2H98_10140 [Permianibacter aggregans]TDQ49186.1 hypothetical protein EV696_105160 [Permianibacter aggregans]
MWFWWLLASATTMPSGANDIAAIYGDWRVTAPLAVVSDSPLSGGEIESWIGASVHYSAERVQFGREQCQRALFDSYTETNGNFFELFQIHFDDLKIKGNETLAVDINCLEADVDFIAGNTVLVVDQNHLAAVVDGVWFELTRQRP